MNEFEIARDEVIRRARLAVADHHASYIAGASCALDRLEGALIMMDAIAPAYTPITKPVEAYCVKDKKVVQMVDAVRIYMKNTKPATQGLCPICGGKVFRIGAD